MYLNNLNVMTIVNTVKISKLTAYNVIKRFKETGNISDQPRCGRLIIVKTKKIVKAVRKKI